MNKWLFWWGLTTSGVLFLSGLLGITLDGEARRATMRADACEQRAKEAEKEKRDEVARRECRDIASEARFLSGKWAGSNASTDAAVWDISYEKCLEHKLIGYP